MKNFKAKGGVFDYANSSGSTILSGAVVVVGEQIGVAAEDIANGATGSVVMSGVFELAKHAGTALAQGAKVFWDTVALEIVAAPGANAKPAAGVAYVAAAGGDSTVQVLLGNIPLRGAAVADESTANATDLATAEALANALKVKVNALLASLRAAGVIET